MGEGASALGLYWLPENPGWGREAAALDQAVAEERTWRKLVELANARLDLIRTIRRRIFPPGRCASRYSAPQSPRICCQGFALRVKARSLGEDLRTWFQPVLRRIE
jgi:hypothetical protein